MYPVIENRGMVVTISKICDKLVDCFISRACFYGKVPAQITLSSVCYTVNYKHNLRDLLDISNPFANGIYITVLDPYNIFWLPADIVLPTPVDQCLTGM